MDPRRAPAAPASLPRISCVLLNLVLAAFVLTGWAVAGGCGSSDAGSPQGSTVPSAAASATEPWSPTTSPTPQTDAGARSAAARVLAATAVVQRFCRLVDEHRYVAARRLLTAPTVWPLRELQAVRRIDFESAQAWGEPDDDEVTLLVGFTATVTWRSPLIGGINDVFFTLTRRVTTGEWLIAAVSTSP
jgi:hypothetical protein